MLQPGFRHAQRERARPPWAFELVRLPTVDEHTFAGTHDRFAPELLQPYLAFAQLQEDEDRIVRAREIRACATNSLRFRLDGIDRRGTEVDLLETGAKVIAHGTIDFEREESVTNRIDPIRERAALIDLLGGPAAGSRCFER